MRAEDLDRIENALSVRLPERYRDALLTSPFPPDSASASHWLVDDPQVVIDATEEFRAVARDETWSDAYVYVGGDGGEETYFVDTARLQAPILVYDYETGKLTPRASGFDAWLSQLHGVLEMLALDARLTRERYENKRWWEFWIRP